MKRIAFNLLILFLASCSYSGNQENQKTYFHYTNYENHKKYTFENSQFVLGDFKFDIQEQRLYASKKEGGSTYLTNEQMADLMKSKITEKLKQDNKLAADGAEDYFKIEVTAEGNRNFTIFSSDNFAGIEYNSLQLKIFQNNQLYAEKKLYRTGNQFIRCGNMLIMWKKFGKSIFGMSGPKEEIEILESCSVSIYNAVKKELGK